MTATEQQQTAPAPAVVAEIGRHVPGAEYRDGALHIDGDGLSEAVRQLDLHAERGAGQRLALVTGGDPDAYAGIPRPTAFQDRDGVQTDYTVAPDIARIATALIAECRDLAFLREVRLRYLWRRKGQHKAGKIVLGICRKLSGLPQYAIGGGDFLIVINAENCRLKLLKAWQSEALVYHELNHIAPPDEDEPDSLPTLIGHDAEVFSAEITRYGLWHESLSHVAPAFEQARLEGL